MSKLLALIAAAVLGVGAARAEEFPPVSGMAQLGSNQMVFVTDLKSDQAGSRLYAGHILPELSMVQPVIEVWPGGDMPNDLEAIAPIPGRANEFMVCESGAGRGLRPRAFHIRLTEAGDGWQSETLGIVQLPQMRDEIEGIAVARSGDMPYVLMLGERGGIGPYTPAWIWWGNLDLSAYTYTVTEEGKWGTQLMPPDKSCFPWGRGCSDLHLDAGGYLWASAAEDMGDKGPFRSWVYRIGRIDAAQPYPVMYEYNRELLWRIDGLKIEALGPAIVAGSVLTYATDDEIFGGIWRPLPPATPQPQPFQPYYGG